MRLVGPKPYPTKYIRIGVYMSAISLLDLGGTMCYESRRAVMVDRDWYQDWAGDEVSHRVVADYAALPFPAGSFQEAAGSCVLEGDECQQWFDEFYRVLYRSGRLRIKGCGELDAVPVEWITLPEQAGFVLASLPAFYMDDPSVRPSRWSMDTPFEWRL